MLYIRLRHEGEKFFVQGKGSDIEFNISFDAKPSFRSGYMQWATATWLTRNLIGCSTIRSRYWRVNDLSNKPQFQIS